MCPQNSKSQSGEKSPWKDPIVWFTGALVLVGYLQWRVYSQQKDIMRDSLVETRKAANAAQWATQLAERAELQIVGFSLPPFHRLQPAAKFQMTYKNFGRTIAANVIANVRLFEMESAKVASTPSILAAGGENHFSVAIDKIGAPFGPEKLEALEAGDGLFRLIVEISFTDVFDTRSRLIYDVQWDVTDRAFKFTVLNREHYKA